MNEGSSDGRLYQIYSVVLDEYVSGHWDEDVSKFLFFWGSSDEDKIIVVTREAVVGMFGESGINDLCMYQGHKDQLFNFLTFIMEGHNREEFRFVMDSDILHAMDVYEVLCELG